MWCILAGEGDNMPEIIIQIFIGIAVAIVFICVIVVLKTRTDSPKSVKAVFIVEALALVITALPYFVDIRIGDMILYYGNAEELEKMENNYAKVINENAELKKTLNENDDKISELETELADVKENRKYKVEFLEYALYSDGDEKNINISDSVAKINGNTYFSQEATEALLGESIIPDEESKMLYIGKYPEEYVNLLSVCEPYDPERGFVLGAEEPFKIQSKTYTDGIRLDAYYSELKSVKFNLGGEYSELSFNIGHIDETELYNTFTLKFYVDEKPVKEIVCNSDTDINQEQTVPLNKGNILKIEWICDLVQGNFGASYGLINLKLK